MHTLFRVYAGANAVELPKNFSPQGTREGNSPGELARAPYSDVIQRLDDGKPQAAPIIFKGELTAPTKADLYGKIAVLKSYVNQASKLEETDGGTARDLIGGYLEYEQPNRGRRAAVTVYLYPSSLLPSSGLPDPTPVEGVGPQGPAGPTGPIGPQGPKGETGIITPNSSQNGYVLRVDTSSVDGMAWRHVATCFEAGAGLTLEQLANGQLKISLSSGGSLPTGGTTGQTLTKNSSTDGDASWLIPATVAASASVMPDYDIGETYIVNQISIDPATLKQYRSTVSSNTGNPLSGSSWQNISQDGIQAKTVDNATHGGIKTLELPNGTLTIVGDVGTYTPSSGSNVSEFTLGFGTIPTANQLDFLPMVRSGSIATTGHVAISEGTASSSVTYNIRKNGTVVGTAVWGASATIGTVTLSSAITHASGDKYELVAPSSPDATHSNIRVTFLVTN